jgi:DNA-binding protein YbaB
MRNILCLGRGVRFNTLAAVLGLASVVVLTVLGSDSASASRNNPRNVVTVTRGPRNNGTVTVSMSGNNQSASVQVNVTGAPLTPEAKAILIRDAINNGTNSFHATSAGAVVTVFNGQPPSTDPAWSVSGSGGTTREGDRVTQTVAEVADADVLFTGSVGGGGTVSVGTTSYVSTKNTSNFVTLGALRQAIANDLTTNGVDAIVLGDGRIRLTVPDGDDYIELDVDDPDLSAEYLGFVE